MSFRRKYETLPDSSLADFAAKVAKLRAEGLSTTTIALRLGLHRNTLNQRLRKLRQATEQA